MSTTLKREHDIMLISQCPVRGSSTLQEQENPLVTHEKYSRGKTQNGAILNMSWEKEKRQN